MIKSEKLRKGLLGAHGNSQKTTMNKISIYEDEIESLPPLPYSTVWFELKAQGEGRLSGYLGSTLRGCIANSLRSVVCVSRQTKNCSSCKFNQVCAYAHLFESQRPKWAIRYPSMHTVPHPMVIIPPQDTKVVTHGQILRFGIRLFGRAIQFFPFIVVSVQRMKGLGKDKIKFELIRVRDQTIDGNCLYSQDETYLEPSVLQGISHLKFNRIDSVKQVTLEFITPTRLVENSIILRQPSLPAIIRSVMFRLSTIAYFHAGLNWIPPITEKTLQSVQIEEIKEDISWIKLYRYSLQQEQRIPLDGFVGSVIYTGNQIGRFLPILKFGEVLHIGKSTVFGLGRILVKEGM